MRVVENKGITLLYISNGIHFKLSSLSANNSLQLIDYQFVAASFFFSVTQNQTQILGQRIFPVGRAANQE